MAEQALYGNTAEPAFPFELVTPRLKWLAPYLAERIGTQGPADYANTNIVLLLNTILVFGRARTACLEDRLEPCRDLVKRLNAELTKASPEASYHKLEIFRRGAGPGTFQITCANSPRFNWSMNATHLDLGRNLDYFAAGHIYEDAVVPERHFVHFCEINTMRCTSGEVVPAQPLQDPEINRKFRGQSTWLSSNQALMITSWTTTSNAIFVRLVSHPVTQSVGDIRYLLQLRW